MQVERHAGKDFISFRSKGGFLNLRRLKPSVAFVQLSGSDNGQYRDLAFIELQSWSASTQLTLFIDLSAATTATSRVMDDWSAFLDKNRARFRRVTIYASSRLLQTAAGIVGHLSHTGDLIRVCSDRESFYGSLQKELPGFDLQTLSDVPARPGVPEKAQSELRWQDADSSIALENLYPGVMLMKIAGYDRGQYIHEAHAALDAVIREYPHGLYLFIDASDAKGITPAVSDAWTQWITKNRSHILQMTMLTRSKIVQIAVSAAQIFSGAGNAIHQCQTEDEFYGKIRAVVPQWNP